MGINSINNAASGTGGINTSKITTAYQAAANSAKKSEIEQAASKTDGFAESAYKKAAEAKIYTSKSVLSKENAETVKRLQQQAEMRMQKLIDTVRTLIEQQGGKFAELSDTLKLKDIDPKVVEEAKKSLEGDGEFSVKTVSSNIINMAKALANGDNSKLGELRAAFEKGFKMAENAFGGKLADICYETYDAVIKGFDELEGKKTESDKTAE
ncbi:MAG TPA: hypothetical protein DCP97_04045 [Ruminococcaceae bacterium]|nr:hypothetical protein [Oscillospiraceae bacterium]